MAIRFPSGLAQSRAYQQQTEDELAQQRRATDLRAKDAANPRIGAPGEAAPSQRQLAGAQKPGIFDAPDLGQGMAAPAGPAGEAMKAAGGDLENIGSRQPTTTAEGDAARRPPPAPPAQEEKKGSIFDTDAEGEKAAFAQQLEANRAQAMQQAEARAGLAGMGLSGATGQLVSDVGRQQQREGQLAMGQFERQQAAAQFQDMQRKAGIWTFEEEFGVDADDDGIIGAPPEPETPEQSAVDAERMNRDVRQQRDSSQDTMSAKIGEDVGSVKTPDSPLDLVSPANQDMGTYQDDAGFTWKVYRRPDGTFFKVTA